MQQDNAVKMLLRASRSLDLKLGMCSTSSTPRKSIEWVIYGDFVALVPSKLWINNINHNLINLVIVSYLSNDSNLICIRLYGVDL